MNDATITWCPYCRSERHTGYRSTSNVVLCSECGTLRLHPRLSEEQCEQMLNLRYERREAAWQKLDPESEVAAHASEIAVLEKHVGAAFQQGRALDVGAGHGGFVHTLSQCGMTAIGIDPYPGFVRIARSHNIDVRQGFFRERDLNADIRSLTFDLICMRGSICYMFDVKDCFRLTRSLLRPDGWLYVRMHVADSLYYLFHPDYASRYGSFVSFIPTIKTLKNILVAEGFTIAAERSVFNSMSKLLFGVRVPWVTPVLDRMIHPVLVALAKQDGIALLARYRRATAATAGKNEGHRKRNHGAG